MNSDPILTRSQSRRDVLKTFALAAVAFVGSRLPARAADPAPTMAPTPAAPASAGPFSVPPLPYAYDALEPHIDVETMHLHHDKHHAAYVKNLNDAVGKHAELAGKSIEELLTSLETIPEDVRMAIRNNGGGHYNHSLFWLVMKRAGGGAPTGDLGGAIDKTFGSYKDFQTQFTKAATGRFGSGWAWLTLDPATGKLAVENTPNQDSPLSAGRVPLLGVDVWEHAYYLKYHNVRADYVAAFYNTIDWDFVAQRYANHLRSV